MNLKLTQLNLINIGAITISMADISAIISILVGLTAISLNIYRLIKEMNRDKKE